MQHVDPAQLTRNQLEEIKRRYESGHPFYSWKPYDKELNVIGAKGLIKGFLGSNRIGKTTTAAYMADAVAIGFDPALSRHLGKMVVYPTPADVWCVSLDNNVSRDVLEPAVKRFMPKEEIAHHNKIDRIYTLKNGSTIGFKCLRGDQAVLMADGTYKQIRDIVVGDRVGVRRHCGRAGIQDRVGEVTKVFSGPPAKLIQVTFRGGRKIVCSPEHKIFHGGWVEAQTLRPSTGKKKCHVSFYGTPPPIHPVRMPWSPWLLGFLIGDGCLRGPQILAAIYDDDVLNSVKLEAWSCGMLRPKQRSKTKHGDFALARESGFGRPTAFKQWLCEIGLWGKLARDKFVPDEVFKAPNDDVSEFLSGLYAADGTITKKPSISLSTSSHLLAKDVQRLLDRFAVKSAVYYVRSTDSWRVVTMGKYATARFLDSIPWVKYIEKAKQLRLQLPQKYKLRPLGVASIKVVEDAPVYDIAVANTNSYMVDGILVHNSCESGVEKFQGTERHRIVFDEEPPIEIFNECLLRVLSCGGDIIFSMTPLLQSKWLYDLLIDEEHMGLGKMGVFCQMAAMKDNPYLPKEVIEAAESYYSGLERDIRVRGIYHVSSLGKVFDHDRIVFQREHAKEPVAVGFIKFDHRKQKYELEEDVGGDLTVYARPDPSRVYVLGCDVGDGDPLGDYSVIQVLEIPSFEQVAVYRQRGIDPSQFGEKVAYVGGFYGDAMVGVESNRAGTATISSLKYLSYPFLYAMPAHLRRPRLRTTEAKEGPTGDQVSMAPQFGWHTTPNTKPLMVNDLKVRLNQYTIRVHCPHTLSELGKFAFLKDDSRATMHGLGAPKGSHDDTVMALAIAVQVGTDLSMSYKGPIRGPFRQQTVREWITEQLEQEALESESAPTSAVERLLGYDD